MLQERIEKSNPRSQLDDEETKRLNKLEAIAERLKRGENVQTLLSMFRWIAVLLISINIYSVSEFPGPLPIPSTVLSSQFKPFLLAKRVFFNAND